MSLHKVILEGTTYKEPIAWEFDTYGEALDDYAKKCVESAEFLYIISNTHVITLVHSADGKDTIIRRMVLAAEEHQYRHAPVYVPLDKYGLNQAVKDTVNKL